MDKSRHAAEHERLCALLRTIRLERNLRQTDVAGALREHQSFVSKYESGERRLDLVELREVCSALGVPVLEAVTRFDEGVSITASPGCE